MRSPGAAHNLLLAEQAFGNFTITMSLQPRVEGADRQNEPPATLARKRERRSGQTAAFARPQKAMSRPQTNIKNRVETHLDGKHRATRSGLGQRNAMQR